jgi:hypothetical protein
MTPDGTDPQEWRRWVEGNVSKSEHEAQLATDAALLALSKGWSSYTAAEAARNAVRTAREARADLNSDGTYELEGRDTADVGPLEAHSEPDQPTETIRDGGGSERLNGLTKPWVHRGIGPAHFNPKWLTDGTTQAQQDAAYDRAIKLLEAGLADGSPERADDDDGSGSKA